MARAWRIEYEDALYHVLSRGNERRANLFKTMQRLKVSYTTRFNFKQSGLAE
jgi:hypothetical protein